MPFVLAFTKPSAKEWAVAVSPASAIPDSGDPATVTPDGRHAWRDRNRLAVVDSLLDFYAEGNLRPGAQAVAERSGVSRRSVFRYFQDLDDLDRTAIARQQERVRHLLEIPNIGEGTLETRIDNLSTQRAALYTAIAPAARVSRLRAPFHPVLAEELAMSREHLRRQLERQFRPELERLDEPSRALVLAAADVMCAFEAFDLLQATRAWDEAQIQRAIAGALTALLGLQPEPASARR
jgi:AcrR family transcriptional regulator